jgi:hypothetical protein
MGLGALVLIFTVSATSFGQSDAPSSNKLVELRLEWLKQVARAQAATQELDLISAPRGGASVSALGDPGAVLKELRPVLSGDYDAVRNNLGVLLAKTRTAREDVQREWAEACRQRDDFREYADRQQSEYGFNFDANTAVGLQPGALDAAMLLWSTAVLIVAWRLRSHERRLAIRQARRAAMAAAVLGLTMFSGCGTTAGDRRPWAEREQASLTAAIKDATAKADAAVAAANARWQAAVDGWANLVTSPSDSVDALLQREEIGDGGRGGLRDRLREVAQETQLAALMTKDAEELRNKLTEDRSRLSELVASSRWRAAAFGTLRIVLAVGLFGLAVAPYWMARRSRRTAVRLAARTCPRCFRRDTLKVEKSVAESRPRYRGGKARKAQPAEEAEAKDEPDRPEDAEVRCTKCGLRMRRSYLKVSRLCFPTVGVRSSGKTHMLVTAYDRIRKRTAPTAAIVQPAPSGSDNDKRFDRLIEEILHRRGEAGATDLVLPDPVLVHLKDCDPAGGNPALINLFDYSGELINPEVDVNQLKATAVRMDGFMLFLDPTQLYGDGANVTLDEQLGMLDQFLAHMRKERGIPVGGAIPVPVAVCIPKFDLLLTENPIGGQAVPFIRHLLHDLNPSPRQVTLDVIKARSDLVEEMLPLVFTGVDVRGIVEGYFGKQVMFFPMSSVSLYEHELGIRDLSRRTIAPFGVAEPLIWLMYMHGYCVFG